jgi:hypothetical protein
METADDMRVYVVVGLILLAIGLFGALLSSSIFFGVLTSGVLLIAYALFTTTEAGKGEPHAATARAPPGQPPAPPVTASFCSNCGAKLAQNARTCPSCGHKLGREPE